MDNNIKDIFNEFKPKQINKGDIDFAFGYYNELKVSPDKSCWQKLIDKKSTHYRRFIIEEQLKYIKQSCEMYQFEYTFDSKKYDGISNLMFEVLNPYVYFDSSIYIEEKLIFKLNNDMYKKIKTIYPETEKYTKNKFIPLQWFMMFDNMLPIIRDDIKIVIYTLNKENIMITFEATKLSNEEAKKNKLCAIQIPIMQIVEKNCKYKFDDIEQIPTMCIIIEKEGTNIIEVKVSEEEAEYNRKHMTLEEKSDIFDDPTIKYIQDKSKNEYYLNDIKFISGSNPINTTINKVIDNNDYLYLITKPIVNRTIFTYSGLLYPTKDWKIISSVNFETYPTILYIYHNILWIDAGLTYYDSYKTGIDINTLSNYPLVKQNETTFTEGFWYDDRDFFKDDFTNLPYPKESTNEIDIEFIEKYKKVVEKCDYFSYMGNSICRLCKQDNGNNEYEIVEDDIKYIFPEGILHYYENHNIKPSNEFKKVIMEFNLDNKKEGVSLGAKISSI